MSASVVYAILNESSAPELTRTVLLQMAADMQVAYDRDFAPLNGLLPVDIVLVESAAESPRDARLFHIVDTIADVPGALAYHTIDAAGRPVLMLGVDENRLEAGSLLDVLSESMTHEIFEATRNPFVNRYLSGPWSDKKVADEASDPVQGSPYREGKTAISNFTLPAWGDIADREGPWDFCNVLKGPFECAPTGYLPFDDGTQQFGEAVSAKRRVYASQHARSAKL